MNMFAARKRKRWERRARACAREVESLTREKEVKGRWGDSTRDKTRLAVLARAPGAADAGVGATSRLDGVICWLSLSQRSHRLEEPDGIGWHAAGESSASSGCACDVMQECPFWPF